LDTLVLCYHAVSPTWTAPLSVTPDALERHLWFLTRLGYHGETFSRALLHPTPPRTLVVTFDDAFASVLKHAQPILAAAGVPGTVFVPTQFPAAGTPLTWAGIDDWLDTPHRDELRCLSWDQLGSLAQSGWEVGSHTRSHARLTTLGDDRLVAELAGSRADVEEHLGRECLSVAYPYGDVDSRVAETARRAGYSVAAAMSSHLAALGVLRWPRLGIYHVDNPLRFLLKMSPPMRALRASRLWPRDWAP
jgi:peptidoglycan/xylan/chitin deacetylase (PgdA/CDA1 family)